ncbi:hypothetical protein ESCO_002118 [Escovopsis weberi]|uniref:Uncharacterized protein n=1 Tax=Escovopsis weberi TaxID=150374 RepID=A0A0M8MZF3_ESCWE|nr:hypothetical protein ESCO_002118 [Escovopsis weberi]
MFSRFKKESRATSDAQPSQPAPKKSLYQSFQEMKRGPGPSEADIKKYTGKSRDELAAWAETQPGVGKNQLAGKITIGPAAGLGGVATAGGFGGWGMGAEPLGENRGMKFPPATEK